MNNEWSEWRMFPDPCAGGYLIAPFGPGCYALRLMDSSLVLFGMSGHVAKRLTSLLPRPLGSGTRRNDRKREFVQQHLHSIQYRTTACKSRSEAAAVEREMRKNASAYLFREAGIA